MELPDLPPCPLCGSDEYRGCGIEVKFEDAETLTISFGCECGLSMKRSFLNFSQSRPDDMSPPFARTLAEIEGHVSAMIEDWSKLNRKGEK